MRRRRTRSSACSRTKPATSPAGICRACASSLRSAQDASIIAMMLGVGGAIAAVAQRRRRRQSGRRHSRPAGNDPPLAAVLPARAGGAGRPRRREVPRRHRPIGQGHVRHLQAPVRSDPVRRAQRRSLHAVASDAGGTRRGARNPRQEQPELGQEGPAGAAAAPRHDARQARPASSIAATRWRAATRSSDTSLPARYARAIATYRHADLRAAIAQIDSLIQAQPNNPYFHELKGQALLEGGKPAEAIAPLHRAIQLAPHPALIQVLLAQALNATNSAKVRRRGGRAAADRACPRARIGRRLSPARHGLWPQGRPRPGRSRLGAGRVHARRPPDRAPACRARQDPFPGRLARLGQGRRYHKLQIRRGRETLDTRKD